MHIFNKNCYETDFEIIFEKNYTDLQVKYKSEFLNALIILKGNNNLIQRLYLTDHFGNAG